MFRTSRREDVRSEHRHTANVDRGEHEEQFEAQSADHGRRHLGEHKVEQPLGRRCSGETEVPCPRRENICDIYPTGDMHQGPVYRRVKAEAYGRGPQPRE